MLAREQTLLQEQKAAAAASARLTIWTVVLWTPLALLVLAVAAVVLMRNVRLGGAAALPGTGGKAWSGIALRYGAAVLIVAVAARAARAAGKVLRSDAAVYHFLSGRAVGGQHRRGRAGDPGHRARGAGRRLLVHPALWVVHHRRAQ